MKVAQKLILLFRDSEGFADALYNGLQPIPKSQFNRLEDKFELSLEQYGIKDQKACGDIANFADDKGVLQASLLLVQHYEPPVLACAINEILRSIRDDNIGTSIILTIPCILPAAKLKCDEKSSSVNTSSSLYGLHIGPETGFSQDILKTVEKPPSSLQIHYEPLACLVQFVRCSKFSTAILIGKSDMREEHEVLHEIGELLAGAFAISFVKSRIKLNVRERTKTQEPWRALYG